MIYHVLPGDSVAAEFSKTRLEGEVIVCRECLVDGDLTGETLDEFWDARANFLMVGYGTDVIDYHEKVAGELSKLTDLPLGSEVNLWFEYELFCSVNMWFCLSLLAEYSGPIFRIEPKLLSSQNRWSGFGKMLSDDLEKCFESRSAFDPSDIKLGAELWDAFRKHDGGRLQQLGETRSQRFPYLREVCDAAGKIETHPREIVNDIVASGKQAISEIFPEFVRRAGVYGFGDAQVERLIQTGRMR